MPTVELTKTFAAEQYSQALESWPSVDLRQHTPVCASLFGDVFFSSDQGYWFLDVVRGTLTCPWASLEAMQSELRLPEGQERYLLASVATAAQERRNELAEAEVYDFVQPPVLGGSLTAANLRRMDFVVATNIAGQIHAQIGDVPPGTRVSGFTKVDPSR